MNSSMDRVSTEFLNTIFQHEVLKALRDGYRGYKLIGYHIYLHPSGIGVGRRGGVRGGIHMFMKDSPLKPNDVMYADDVLPVELRDRVGVYRFATEQIERMKKLIDHAYDKPEEWIPEKLRTELIGLV